MTIKSSGKRTHFAGGYQRDDREHKLRYDLIPLELLKDLARHYTDGGRLYGFDNWRLAKDSGIESFKHSAFRHFIQWMNNEKDERHDMACIWNMINYEWHKRYKHES